MQAKCFICCTHPADLFPACVFFFIFITTPLMNYSWYQHMPDVAN